MQVNKTPFKVLSILMLLILIRQYIRVRFVNTVLEHSVAMNKKKSIYRKQTNKKQAYNMNILTQT